MESCDNNGIDEHEKLRTMLEIAYNSIGLLQNQETSHVVASHEMKKFKIKKILIIAKTSYIFHEAKAMVYFRKKWQQ